MANKIFHKVLLCGHLLLLPAIALEARDIADNSGIPILNSPQAAGALERARVFAADGNWLAVQDQIRIARQETPLLNPEDLIETDYLAILAAYHLGDFETIQLIDDYIAAFPSAGHIPEVRLLKGDLYFYKGDYSKALQAYNEMEASSLTGKQRTEYIYHKTISQIKLGYYAEARKGLKTLGGVSDYANAATFYDAYIDYVNGDYDSAYQKFSQVTPSSEKGLEAEFYITQIDFGRGDYEKVASAGDRLLRQDVDMMLLPETLKVTGISHFKNGNKAKARQLLERYLELSGANADLSALYTLGTLYYENGEKEKAKQLFTQLTDDKNDIAQSSWLYLGQIATEEGDGPQAAIAFDRAAKMAFNKEVAETALYNLAVTSVSGTTVPFGSSIEILEKFIADYPNSSYAKEVSSYLATAYYNDKNYEKALESINKIKNPDVNVQKARQKILYELGMKQLASGQTDKAIVSLKEAASMASLNPDIAAQANLWLGDAYYKKKDYKASGEAYSASLSTKKTAENTAIAEYNLGYALMKQKDYRGALSSFRNALGTKGLTATQIGDAKLRIADCLFYTGKLDEALQDYKAIAAGSGQDAVYAAIREAEIIGKQGDTATKIKILKELDEKGNAGIWTQDLLAALASAYGESGDDANAALVNERIIESNPSESATLQALYALAENAENLYEKGDKDAALRAYVRLEESGYSEFYPIVVVGIMRTTDDPEEVLEYSEKVLAMPGVSPDLSEEATYMAALCYLDGDTAESEDKGLDMLTELAQNPSREWGAKAAIAMAKFYLEVDEPEEAEKVLQEFVESDADNQYMLALAYIYLADSYLARNDKYSARLYLETVRDNYPGKEKEIFDMINSRLNSLR